MKNFKEYAPIAARLGVGVVFFVFGIWQLIQPQYWLGYLPNFPFSGVSLTLIIVLNGILDGIVGLSLLLGFYPRIFSALGALHLFVISISLGFNDVTMRDIGLILVLISVFLNGEDKWCIDRLWRK